MNTTWSAPNACYVQYQPASNKLYLRNDANTQWLGGFSPATAFTISNGQCTLNGAGSAVSTSGNTLTMTLPLTFTTSFGGARSVFLYARDTNNVDSGTQQRGSWTVDAAPTVISVNPNSGSGAAGVANTFTFRSSDLSGGNDITGIVVVINSTLINSPS